MCIGIRCNYFIPEALLWHNLVDQSRRVNSEFFLSSLFFFSCCALSFAIYPLFNYYLLKQLHLSQTDWPLPYISALLNNKLPNYVNGSVLVGHALSGSGKVGVSKVIGWSDWLSWIWPSQRGSDHTAAAAVLLPNPRPKATYIFLYKDHLQQEHTQCCSMRKLNLLFAIEKNTGQKIINKLGGID